MSKQRIAYIDAMRGFTMILVVFSHICNYCLGDRSMAFNDIFFLFRMPCFFFISGWLFEHPGTVWNRTTMTAVARRKFAVQIVPTVIFLLLLAPPPLFFSRLGAVKGGYWFTFALFEYFVLYMLSARFLRRWALPAAVAISVAAFCYDIFYNCMIHHSALPPIAFDALGFIGFMTWRFYLFFYLGTMAKRHFDIFVRLTRNRPMMALAALLFAAVALLPHGDNALREYVLFAAGGVLGTVLLFSFFSWLYTRPIASHASLCTWLPFVGRRTLDIYLLHYFFLPRFLLPYGTWLRSFHSQALNFSAAISLALMVVAVCLLISRLLRRSSFLAHWLFGAREK